MDSDDDLIHFGDNNGNDFEDDALELVTCVEDYNRGTSTAKADNDLAPSPSKRHCQNVCEILTSDQILSEMNRIAIETQSVIGLPLAVCRTMLSQYKWSKEMLLEKFYESPEFSKRKEYYGAYDPENPKELVDEKYRAQGYCEICDETKPLQSLNCLHYFCFDCWRLYAEQKVNSNGTAHILCPSTSCKVIVDDLTVRRLLIDPIVRKAYDRLRLNTFVETNRFLKFCTGKNCNYVAKSPVIGCSPVRCNCGHFFCFSCGEMWHEPISCELLKIWLKQCSDDSETFNWINAFTKDCPKCKTAIEKNGGCNHMTCRSASCTFEFCWVCLGDWKAHTANYSCNRFSPESKNVEKRQADSRDALQRYLHYFNRFQNHDKSKKLEYKLHEGLAERIKTFQANGCSYAEMSFLKEAVDILSDARQTLMFTYAFAFYLKQGNNPTMLFEDNQRDLELATEQLSEYLEKDLDEEKDFHGLTLKIQDKMRYVSGRRQLLLKHCSDGTEKREWVYGKEDVTKGIVATIYH